MKSRRPARNGWKGEQVPQGLSPAAATGAPLAVGLEPSAAVRSRFARLLSDSIFCFRTPAPEESSPRRLRRGAFQTNAPWGLC